MIRVHAGQRSAMVVLLFMAMGWLSTPAAAQGIGSGPLTSPLANTEPQTGVLNFGRVRVAPGITIREIGWDSNVFDEAEDPKDDYVAAIAPDLSAFMKLRFIQLSVFGGGDYNYFKDYESERSSGFTTRGRVDLLLSRVRPFFGAAAIRQRTRPNGEIDTRADRRENELSGGLAFELGAHSSVYGAYFVHSTEFESALEDGVDLGRSLSRDTAEYSGGVRTDLTPLAQLTVSGHYREDRFKFEPFRNGEHRMASAALRIGAEAMISGSAIVAYRDYKAVDPNVKPYRGVTGQAALTYSFLEIGRLTLIGNRGMEYSFDGAEAYYLENSATLVYTHRLFGAVDAQVRGAVSYFDYSFSEVVPAHTDTLETLGGSLGYNLRNRTRIGLNYEYSRRGSDIFPERNYQRRRVFLSWTFAI